MKATTTKLMIAVITRPMLMRASPMSNPIWKMSGLPKMALMIGKITPARIASTMALV
jgi:hypothetical protein